MLLMLLTHLSWVSTPPPYLFISPGGWIDVIHSLIHTFISPVDGKFQGRSFHFMLRSALPRGRALRISCTRHQELSCSSRASNERIENWHAMHMHAYLKCRTLYNSKGAQDCGSTSCICLTALDTVCP